MKKHIIKYSIILSILLLIALGVVLFFKNSTTPYKPRPHYDKEGFINYTDIKTDTLKLNNNKFEFTLNTSNTTFKIKNKETGNIISSNCEKQSSSDDLPLVSDELFMVYYEKKLEAPTGVSVNKECIQYNKFMYRYDNSSIEILYMVGGKNEITREDLPRIVGVDKFLDLIIYPIEDYIDTLDDLTEKTKIQTYFRGLKNQYTYDNINEYYFLQSNLTSKDAIERLYYLIYEISLYTYEDYVDDNTKYDFAVVSKNYPYMEFSIKYTLTNNGLMVRLINDSIFETEEYMIAYIDILPAFYASDYLDEGSTIIPDGQGMVINHNNGKYNQTVYEKRVYGTDYSIGNGSLVYNELEEKISLPMYAFIQNETSYINTVISSAGMSSIMAGFRTLIRNGNYLHKNPFAYYRYYLRENDAFVFHSTTSDRLVSIWSKEYNKTDFISEYIFINSNDHFKIAKTYQEYITQKYNLEQKTNPYKLSITLLGGYKDLDYILGIKQVRVKPLTTIKQANTIINELNEKGLTDVIYSLKGFTNGGIYPSLYDKIENNKNIASKKELAKILQKDNVYYDFLVSTAYSKKGINPKKDVVNSLLQSNVSRTLFDPATSLALTNMKIDLTKYYLKEDLIKNNFKTINKYLEKNNINNISLGDYAETLTGDYTIHNVLFRNDIENNIINNINTINEKSILLRNPSEFAYKELDYVLDLPIKSTLHKSADYSISFVQLVLNSFVNYFNVSTNLNSKNNSNYYFLKTLETNSRLQYTLTYNNTSLLSNTYYNNIMSTEYEKYVDELVYYYNLYSSIGIDNATITNHEILNNRASVIKVTYSNDVVITINYDLETYQVGIK